MIDGPDKKRHDYHIIHCIENGIITRVMNVKIDIKNNFDV